MIIYIIHDPDVKDRETYIETFINTIRPLLNFELKYVWSKKGKELTEEEVNRFKDAEGYNNSINKIRNASSLTLHHMQCLQDFVETDSERCLILEDDCYITSIDNFIEVISNNEYFDTIYLGEGCLPDIHNSKPKGLIPIKTSRCTEAILYSKNGARVILEYFKKTQENMSTCCHLDFFFNIAYTQIENYKNFHYHPAPIKQGTCTGKLKSTIQEV